MATDKQIVICLTRVSFPPNVQTTKAIISVLGSQGQQFIQKERTVKKRHINLYRECLFLSQLTNKLTFRVYSVSEEGKRCLLKQLTAAAADLECINSKPTMLKVEDGGFELNWDSWIFSEQSEDLNSLTDRDYSELDLPFDNMSESEDEENAKIPSHLKQLSSTDGSWSPIYQDFTETQGNFPSGSDYKNQVHRQRSAKRLSALQQVSKKNIKCEAYGKLIKGISGMFAEKKQALNLH